VAVGADAAQVAGQRAGGDAVRHLPSGDLRRTAGDAINPTRPARLSGSLPAFLQEPQQFAARDQCRPSIVDGRQALLQPAADRVLMDAEPPRDVLHRIVPMNLYQPGVGMANPHPSAPLMPSQALWQPRIGVRSIASNTGFEPRFEVIPAVNNAPPELAVNGAIPAQAQLRERARREPHKLGGLVRRQCDRIADRHLSLTENQPDSPAVSDL